MTDKQPDPLRVADELDCHNARLDRQAAKVIRTQHAAIERKDALLRQAREVLGETRVNLEDYDFGPAYEGTKRRRCEVLIAIKQELSQ